MKTVYELLRGFNVYRIYADRGFESCRAEIAKLGSELLCCDKNARVHFAERGICFIKERIQCIRYMLPLDLINQQAKQEGQLDGMIFCNIDGVTPLDDLEVAPGGDDLEFEYDDADDQSYLTSDDQSMDGDNELGNGFEPIEEKCELETE